MRNMRRVKTRKAHRCWGCARMFPAGTKMDTVTSTDCGKIFTGYWCDVCQHVWAEDYYTDDTVLCGEVRANDREAWEHAKAALEKS